MINLQLVVHFLGSCYIGIRDKSLKMLFVNSGSNKNSSPFELLHCRIQSAKFLLVT